jgi:transcriptional regulator with PAS, ATPase and Fis domain
MPTLNSTSSCFESAPEPPTSSSPDRAGPVLICESLPSRAELISRLVSESGAEPFLVDPLGLLNLPTLSSGVALFGFAECSQADAARLNMVRALAGAGHIVICYGQNMRTWPLAKRCNVLVAGALALFDSATLEFSTELRRTLAEVLRLQIVKRDEESRIKCELGKLGVIGESRMMRSIFNRVERAATLSDLPVLITGETGTGKELLVNAIHRLDRKRSAGPLVALNCGAISAGVAESELFGHRRGAFTGAERHRKGLIRAADGGILFLDEIGDLDTALQSKLLRVLQENRVLGVGEDLELPVDVRVIAATNRNLEEMVARGEFRDDLYYRLNILSVHIPALRLRPADLRPLVKHFVEKHRNLCGGRMVAIDREFIEALTRLELPGNAREVENLVRRGLVAKTSDSPLSLADLPREVLEKLAEQSIANPNSHDGRVADKSDRQPLAYDDGEPLFKLLQIEGNLARTLQRCERSLVASALVQSSGNQSSAAKLLGITPRSVYNKMRKHQLH